MKKQFSKIRLLVIPLAMLLIPTACFAETSRQEMIDKVLDLQHFNQLFDEHVGLGFSAEAALFKARFKGNPNIPETEKTKLFDLFDRFPKLLKEKIDTTTMARKAVQDFFDKTFTDEDLKVMAAFYEQPAGQKECVTVTKLTTSMMEASSNNLGPRFKRAAMQAYDEAISKGIVPKPAAPSAAPTKSAE